MVDPSANIIFGAVVDENYTGELLVTIIATGFTQVLPSMMKGFDFGPAKVPANRVEDGGGNGSMLPSRFRQMR